jgi:hypothetical protein
MQYDPATQAALSNPVAWIVFLLLVGALVIVSMVTICSVLAFTAGGRRQLYSLMAVTGLASVQR